MSDTDFTDNQTKVIASWLNEVNDLTYALPNVKNSSFGAKGDGTTNDMAAFVSADTNGDFLVTPGTYSIQSNITITNDMVFMPGAVLKPSSGIVVTINGAIDAGLWQIFDTSAGGSFVFGTKISDGRTEWYGAVWDNSTNDAAAIQSAFDAFNSVKLPDNATAICNSTLTIKSNLRISGGGQDTVIKVNHAGWGLTFNDDSSFCELSSFKIQLVTNALGGVDLGFVNTYSTFYHVFNDVQVFGSNSSTPVEAEIGFGLGKAVATDDVLWNRFFGCLARYCGVGFKLFDNANSNEFHGCIVRNSAKGIWLDGSAGARGTWNCTRNIIIGGSIDTFTVGAAPKGVYVNEADYTYLSGTYIETSGASRPSIEVTADSINNTFIGAFHNTPAGITDNGISTLFLDQDRVQLPTGVGIGIGSPDGTLHVHTASAGAVTAPSLADDIVAENSENGGFTALVPDAKISYYSLGSKSLPQAAFMRYSYTANQMKIATVRTNATIDISAGNVAAGLRLDGSNVARDTRLFVYDVDNGTLEKVTVGIADSGGTNFKLLRIPN